MTSSPQGLIDLVSDEALARRAVTDSYLDFACQVSLENAHADEDLLPMHHTHDALEPPDRSRSPRAAIRSLLDGNALAYIEAHYAAAGFCPARTERDGR